VIVPWLVPWGLLAVALGLALRSRATGPLALAALLALCAPLTCPEHGFSSTVVTAWAVIVSVRLLDLRAFVGRRNPSVLETTLWLLIPVVRCRPDDAARRTRNRARAWRPLLWAAGERATWELLDRVVLPRSEPLGAWPVVALILFFVLNFTALAQLISALSLAVGCDVEPAFDAPLLSRSPREFWSRRWNKFIARFLLKHVALELPRRFPAPLVVVTVFAVSGALHEYFVFGAVGAGAGIIGTSGGILGSMMAFFLLQGLAVLVETRVQSRMPRALGNAATFVWMMATAPLFFFPLGSVLPAFGYPRAWLPF